jgi:hypothetical protein
MREPLLYKGEMLWNQILGGFSGEDIMISLEPPPPNMQNYFTGQVTSIIDRGAVLPIQVDLPPEFSCLIMLRYLLNR